MLASADVTGYQGAVVTRVTEAKPKPAVEEGEIIHTRGVIRREGIGRVLAVH